MPLIECNNLSLKFGGRTLLQGFDWQVNPGECWGILGPNGCGKSTLLHTVSALGKRQSGTVRIDGVSIEALSRRKLAHKIGLLPQETPYRFPVKVKDVVLAGRFSYQPLLGNYADQDRILANSAMKAMSILTLADRSVETLSGGESRRVAMATLLCQSPDVALLDEPENHLDPGIRFRLLKRLKARFTSDGHAMVMVLHDPTAAVRLCSHLILMPGNGDSVTGSVMDVATADTLSELYGHKMRELSSDDGPIYYPE